MTMWVTRVWLIAAVLVGCAERAAVVTTSLELAQKPIDLILLLDQSSSMKLTDPEHNRIAASRFLINEFAAEWTQDQPHRAGLVNFGDLVPPDPADAAFGPIPLDTAKVKEREALLSRIKPLDLRYTSFIGAFRTVRRLLAEVRDTLERKTVIVLLTDGEPDDLRKLSRAAYFNELTRYVEDSLAGVSLHVLGIDIGNRYWATNEPYWRRIARSAVRLASADEKTLKQTFWQVLSQELAGGVDRWVPIPAEGYSIQLPPYLEAVKFVFHKDNEQARVVVTDPAGRRVTEAMPNARLLAAGGRTESWRIDEPEPGTWVCRVEGGTGGVEVGTMRIPVQPRLIEPELVHPQGKPFPIVASFLRKDGKPIKELAAYRLTMYTSVRLPGQTQPMHVDLVPASQPGLFYSTETIPAASAGEYAVTLSMKTDRPVADTTILVKVEPIPYIEPVVPRSGERQMWLERVRVQAQLRLAGNVLNPSEYFAPTSNPNAILFCQVFGDAGQPLRSGHLRFLGGEKDARFGVEFPAIRQNGRYRLVLSLDADGRDGRHYSYTTKHIPLYFFRRMGVLDFVIFRWYIVLGVVLFAVLVWDWQRILRENRWPFWRLPGLPQLYGDLEVFRLVRPSEDSGSEQAVGSAQSDPLAGIVTPEQLTKKAVSAEAAPEQEQSSAEHIVVVPIEEKLGQFPLRGRKCTPVEGLDMQILARPDNTIIARWKGREYALPSDQKVELSDSLTVVFRP